MTSAAYIRLAIAVAALAAAGATGWFVNGWRLNSEIAELQRQHAQAMFVASEAAARELAKVTAERDAIQATFNGLDAAGLAKLKGDADETERLRTCVRNGTCGLRIRASCPTNTPNVPGAPQGGGLDTGTGSRLDANAESDYFALRGGISRIQNKLATCQAALGCMTGQRACPAPTASPNP